MESKPKLILMCGIPGSGKTTMVNEQFVTNGFCKVSRDDIRMSTFNTYDLVDEDTVSSIQDASVFALLKRGKNVVIDNTHYKIAYLKEAIAKYGKLADIVIQIVGSELSLAKIKEQNKNRTKVVPEAVLDFMWPAFRYIVKNFKQVLEYRDEINSIPKIEVYKQDPTLPQAVIVDIDGTIAHMADRRGPFDWKKVGLDEPDTDVLDVIRSLSTNFHIFFVSGRDASCRKETESWLDNHYGLAYDGLLMRPEGNFEKDSIIKERIFEYNFKDKYYITMLFDDRDQVVRKYREMGLKVAQVAYGDF